MRRKRKTSPLKDLPKDDVNEKINTILAEEGKKPLLTPVQIHPSNNGINYSEVQSDGFFWVYKGVYVFKAAHGKDGFKLEEVPLIVKYARPASKQRSEAIGLGGVLNDAYVLVEPKRGESFYVHVDDMGMIWLPELIGSNLNGTRNLREYGKTKDIDSILRSHDSEVYLPEQIKNYKRSK